MTEYNERQPARRVFAEEFNDSNHIFSESDDERAPNFSLLRTGEKANRVFVVGTLTEKNDVGNDSEYWQARVVDPTGTFFVYSGEYTPEATEVLRNATPPEYVAITGKVDSYKNDDDETVVNLRAETVTIVDEKTRDRWIAETARQTLERINKDDDEKYVQMVKETYTDGAKRDDYREVVMEAVNGLGEQTETDE